MNQDERFTIPFHPVMDGKIVDVDVLRCRHLTLPASIYWTDTALIPNMPTNEAELIESPVARLYSRPGLSIHLAGPGLQRLQIERRRLALLYVPESAIKQSPASLAIMLHGAGGNAEHGMDLLRAYADHAGVILLAPESRKSSWDIISDAQYGPDVRFIDSCLTEVFGQFAIGPKRIALGGFSDGASYALSLGLSNGALFQTILAFSPGFMAPVRIEDEPRIFLSHGTADEVLPIDVCGRRVRRALRSHPELTVEYREFQGRHTVPAEMKEAALRFFLQHEST
jgi:predicted esterase